MMLESCATGFGQITVADRTLPYCESARRIWDRAQSGVTYNAFTGLTRFQGQWYCSFREATKHHVDATGKARVIRSDDGQQWESVALLAWPGCDVRDPMLSISGDGRLVLNCGVRLAPAELRFTHSVTWTSANGTDWTAHQGDQENIWRWSVTWHRGAGYSMGYRCDEAGRSIIPFYRTRDGRTWTKVVADCRPPGYCDESCLAFGDDDTAYCLLRRDPPPPSLGVSEPQVSALWGVSQPPYQAWSWRDLGVRCGGPVMLRLRDGRFLAAVRLYDGGVPAFEQASSYARRLSLCWIEPRTARMREALVIAAGGKGGAGYAGLVEHEGELWMSFYSGHEYGEEAAAIYLARLPIADLP